MNEVQIPYYKVDTDTLVNHVVRTYKNLGVSVATLYGANTLGAALGSALTGLFVLYYFGLRSTIYIAAALLLFATGWVIDRVAKVSKDKIFSAGLSVESAKRTIENSPPIHRWGTSGN